MATIGHQSLNTTGNGTINDSNGFFMQQRPHSFIYTFLFIALVIAALSYLFHPDVGMLTLMVNGQPVTDPWIHLAAVPSAIVVLLLIGGLSVLLFMGMGLMLFMVALFFAMAGVFIVAPFFWPVLVIFFLLLLLLSAGSNR